MTYWNDQKKINEVWCINDPDWEITCNTIKRKRRYAFSRKGEEMFVLRRIPKHFIEELSCSKKQT
jgi:chorismate-pyruvate lyase